LRRWKRTSDPWTSWWSTAGPEAGGFTQVQESDWDAAYALTLQSALRLVQAVLPGMRARKWGRIVALESVTVKQPLPNMVLSNAFRAAVAAALKTLAGEVAAEGITINTIATGLVDTDRFRSVFDTRRRPRRRSPPSHEAGGRSRGVCAPGGLPLREPASYLTGQTLSIDGGLTAGLFG